MIRLLASLLLFATFAAHAQQHPHVLLISVDGMKPEYVTHAAEHNLKLPTLTRFVTEGAYADGVIGILPTLTHPSHTTLVTGVWPAQHGIFNNRHFDPLLKNPDEWYWFAPNIKVPTLWQAAHSAGITTASIFWPVTVNATGIDYLIPAYPVRTREDAPLLEAISRPNGYLEHLEATIGPLYITQPVPAWDERLTDTAIALIRDAHPGLLTLHLVALDSAEHIAGPFSPQANAVMEATDALIARLIAAERSADPAATIIVVSDHGFALVHTRVNLLLPFIDAGLITLAPNHTIANWKATLWSADGSAAVILKDPTDAATLAQTSALLNKLAADPQYGIARILTHDQLIAEGGDPAASFFIAIKSGFAIGEALTGNTVISGLHAGTHGYAPDVPDMRSSFFALGPTIAHRDLGLIDMRQIAPTIAALLGAKLPTATQPTLNLR